MEVLIVGDVHFDRSLPYSQMVEGKNDRYEFQKRLFASAIKDHKTVILLGDITHQKDMIDGKVMSDYIDLVRDKNIIHVLGNHDWSGDDYQASMGEVLSKVLPNYVAVKSTKVTKIGQVAFVFASYYAPEELIQEQVEEAIATGASRVLVCGHFNFYNEMMGGKKFPVSWMNKVLTQGVRFILGHIHPPAPIGGNAGEYLGVMSPLRFKEAQGRMLLVDTNTAKVRALDYEFGEEFVELDYEDKTTWAFRYTGNENKYLKVYYDSGQDPVSVREDMLERFPGVRSLIVVPKVGEVQQQRGVEANGTVQIANEEEFLLEVAVEKGYDPNRVITAHQKIKELV